MYSLLVHQDLYPTIHSTGPAKALVRILMSLVACLIAIGPAIADDTGKLTYTLKSPGYSIHPSPDGFDNVRADGYLSYAVPGYPDLPCKIYRFAVPFDVDAGQLKVGYSILKSETVGKYNIRELPPLATRVDQKRLVSGKADVYLKNAYFPEDVVQYLGFSRMRKWKFINIKYTPFQYNPMTHELKFIPEVTVTIDYSLLPRTSGMDNRLTDNKMDGRAKEMFDNFSEAKAWYVSPKAQAAPSITYDYVIITTNSIESISTKLSDFVSYLSGKGFSPLVITEDEYAGLTGQSPNGIAEKIRQWLIDHYSTYGILYVLLIGNPDPDDPSSGSDSVGDVPMKMCWPRNDQSSYKESPTDYFYADLTGNWDLNGNGYFGEYNGDRSTETEQGVDFANEVYVGRIPFYSGVMPVSDLDSVLAKTMAYGNAASIDWRKSALLPMSFSDGSTDGAYLSEAMMSNYLSPNGYSDYTLYMQGSYCSAANSAFGSDQELLNDVSWQRWRNYSYGMVWWWGHGNEEGAYVGYSGCPSSTSSPQIIGSWDVSSLNNSYPSHVYQCSCLNGYPEDSSNLGTALLYNGAITTTSASRVSWYAIGSWYVSPYFKYSCDNASIGYYYGQELVNNEKVASKALFDVKSDMGTGAYWGGASWMNLFDFNLYGDPATSIVIKGSACPDCPPDGDIGVTNDVTYPAGSDCTCTNATELTIGANVTIQAGATVTFIAPVVTFQPGFSFSPQDGATLNVHQ